MALNYPVGGAVVADDLVWVCNQGDNTIEQLHFDGTSAGSPIAEGSLNGPSGCCLVPLSPPQVWVNNNGDGTISRLLLNGSSAGPSLAGGPPFSDYGITVVGSEVWLPRFDGTIARFDFTGSLVGTITGLSQPNFPTVVGADLVWVPDQGAGNVKRYHFNGASAGVLTDGTFSNNFGASAGPFSAALVDTDLVWVATVDRPSNTNWISRFHADGTPGHPPVTPGASVAWSPQSMLIAGGRVWAIDPNTNLIRYFNPDGSLWVAPGTVYPPDHYFASRGVGVVGPQVWISKVAFGRVIERLLPDGSVASGGINGYFIPTHFYSAGFDIPQAILAVGADEAWVATQQGSQILRLYFDGSRKAAPLSVPTIAVTGIAAHQMALVGGTKVWLAPGDGTMHAWDLDGTHSGNPLVSDAALTDQAPGPTVVGAEVWVPVRDTNSILRYNPDGTSAGAPITGGGISGPAAIAVKGSTAWVLNTGDGTLLPFAFDGSRAGSPLAHAGLAAAEALCYVPATSAFWAVGDSALTPAIISAVPTPGAGVRLFAFPFALTAGTFPQTIQLTRHGAGDDWTPGTPGSPDFALGNAGGAASTLESQTIVDGRHATVVITPNTTTGRVTVTDSDSGAAVQMPLWDLHTTAVVGS